MEEPGLLIIPASQSHSDAIFRPHVTRGEQRHSQVGAISTPVTAETKGAVTAGGKDHHTIAPTTVEVKDEEIEAVTCGGHIEDRTDVARRNLFGEDNTEIATHLCAAHDAKVAPENSGTKCRVNDDNGDVSGNSRTKRVRFQETGSASKDSSAVIKKTQDRPCRPAPGSPDFKLTFTETATQSPPPFSQYSGAVADFSDAEDQL